MKLGYWHCPNVQLVPLGQTQPQAPQLLKSDCRSMQPAGVWQQTVPAAQGDPLLHAHSVSGPRRMQVSPSMHTTPSHTQRPWASQLKLLTGPTSHWS